MLGEQKGGVQKMVGYLAVAQRRPVECPAETERSPSCAVQEGSHFNVLVWPRAELFLLFNAN